MTNLSSASARFLPTHAKRPMLKGVKARWSATNSGREYHRSGMNSEAWAKDLSTMSKREGNVSQILDCFGSDNDIPCRKSKDIGNTYDDPWYIVVPLLLSFLECTDLRYASPAEDFPDNRPLGPKDGDVRSH